MSTVNHAVGVNQFGPPGRLMLTTQTYACPAAAPHYGVSFNLTWDSSF